MKDSRYLGTDPVWKLILKFAIPSIIAMLVMSLYNIVDQLFIGHGVGYLGNAATNIVFPVNVLTIAVSMLIGEGACALYSIRLGEGRHDEAKRTITNAVFLLSLVGATFAAVCLVALRPLLGFLGATEAVMPYAIDYAAPIVWGVPFQVVAGGLNAMTRANGSPRYSMLAMASGAIMNTILDPIFIFTFDMGVFGAAVATAISQFLTFCIAMNYLARRNGFHIERRHCRLDGSVARKLLACGFPSSLSQMAIMFVIVLLNKSLVQYGEQSIYGTDIPLAVHGITMKVNQILFAVLIGIAAGSQPIIGYNFGAGHFDRVKQTFRLSATAATVTGALASIAFLGFPQSIINLFGSEEGLYNEFGVKCFRIFLCFTALNGFTLLAGSFFQSMARVRWAAAIQLSRQFVFMVPAVSILPKYLGLEGVLMAGPITDFASFVLAVVLVTREVRRLKLRAPEPLPEEDALVNQAVAENTSASGRFYST